MVVFNVIRVHIVYVIINVHGCDKPFVGPMAMPPTTVSLQKVGDYGIISHVDVELLTACGCFLYIFLGSGEDLLSEETGEETRATFDGPWSSVVISKCRCRHAQWHKLKAPFLDSKNI